MQLSLLATARLPGQKGKKRRVKWIGGVELEQSLPRDTFLTTGPRIKCNIKCKKIKYSTVPIRTLVQYHKQYKRPKNYESSQALLRYFLISCK